MGFDGGTHFLGRIGGHVMQLWEMNPPELAEGTGQVLLVFGACAFLLQGSFETN